MELWVRKAGGVDQQRPRPAGEADQEDETRQIVGGRPRNTDLLALVEPVHLGQEHPRREPHQEETADDEVASLKRAHECLDEEERDREPDHAPPRPTRAGGPKRASGRWASPDRGTE